MNALELADQIEAGAAFPAYPPMPRVDAAAMLRRQHEAIVKLREALAETAQTLVWMQWGDCRKFTQRPLLTVHEAVSATEQALKDTEEFK